MRRRPYGFLSAFLAVSVAIAAVLTGCEPPVVTEGGQPRPEAIKSVISLSPSTTEIVGSINYNQVLKGRTQADDFPMAVKDVAVVASVKPDYESIAAIKPQLVVYDKDLYNAQDIEKINQLGFKTYVFDAKTIDDFVKQVQLLGAAIAAETNASSYADKVIAAKNAAMGDPISPSPKVAVILVSEGTEHYIAGTEGFLADVIRVSGGSLVGPKADRFVPLSPESVIAQNPDIIVIPFEADQNKQDVSQRNAEARVRLLLADPRFKSLNAIKNRKIVPIDEDVLTRRGYRVDKLIDELHRRFAAAMRG
ncbi:MAG: helical backbone metal receptor [Fimbriimonadaceae bacterium]|nr:helical backbone metal receptor [Fimbriimonadaceae bacterium]